MADSFIYRLNESTIISSNDYTVFDIVDTNTGQYYTKKVSINTLIGLLSTTVGTDIQTKINRIQATVTNISQNIANKLDKTGLNFSSNEKMFGPLSVNSTLSVFDVSHFLKSIDLHQNKITNVATPETDFDGANKKYVDDKYNTLNIPNVSNLILKSGDVMTGFLTLPSYTPNSNNHAVTKKYVDDLYPYNTYLHLSGGSLTGPLHVLDPNTDTEVVNKKYVDDRIINGTYLPLSGGVMTGYVSILEPTFANHPATKQYVDNLVSPVNISNFVPISGNVSITNFLSVINPTLPFHASNKQYVDSKVLSISSFLPLSGGSMTGYLSVLSPNTHLEVVNKQYIDDIQQPFSKNYLPLSGGTINGSLYVNDITESSPLNQVVNKKYIDSKYVIGSYLPVSGGTMTGPLSVLNPTENLHAANKSYVDTYFKLAYTASYVPVSGNIAMTGPLSVLNPTEALHPANKAYVDTKIGSTSTFLTLSGGTATGALSVLTPTQDNEAATKKYVDDKFPPNKYLELNGGTVTGPLYIPELTRSDPSNQAANKGYIDLIIRPQDYIPLSGYAVITGPIYINSNPVSSTEVVNKKYVDDRIPTLSTYVSLTGGTMTGYLSVQTPTLDQHAANKAYLDSRTANLIGKYLLLSGGSMTGPLSVLEPNAPSEIATKSYVDSINPSGKYLPLSGGQMTGPVVLSAYCEEIQTILFTTAGRLIIDFGNNLNASSYSNTYFINLKANITGIELRGTFVSPLIHNITFFIKQLGTNALGFNNITWATTVGTTTTNVAWASGYSAPVVTKLENAIDIITLTCIGSSLNTAKWYGFSSGQNFA